MNAIRHRNHWASGRALCATERRKRIAIRVNNIAIIAGRQRTRVGHQCSRVLAVCRIYSVLLMETNLSFSHLSH